MYNNPFYLQGYPQMMMAPNLMRGFPATARTLTNTTRAATSTGGLFQRLGSTLSGIKTINWGGLINNTSKTLGIINQTIPIVRQVGPMVNNMRSMMRVASLFKDETDNQKYLNTPKIQTNNKNINNNTNINNQSKQSQTINTTQITPQIPNNKIENNTQEYDSSPTFFINT